MDLRPMATALLFPILLCGCGATSTTSSLPLQPGQADAQQPPPSNGSGRAYQWGGPIEGGASGDGVDLTLTQVDNKVLGHGILQLGGELIPVIVTGLGEVASGGESVTLFLEPRDESTTSDEFQLTGSLTPGGVMTLLNTATNQKHTVQVQLAPEVADEEEPLFPKLYEDTISVDVNNPEQYHIILWGHTNRDAWDNFPKDTKLEVDVAFKDRRYLPTPALKGTFSGTVVPEPVSIFLPLEQQSVTGSVLAGRYPFTGTAWMELEGSRAGAPSQARAVSVDLYFKFASGIGGNQPTGGALKDTCYTVHMLQRPNEPASDAPGVVYYPTSSSVTITNR